MSEWVPVAEGPGEKAVEIETEEDGMLLVSAVAAHFPGTTTLKYNGPTGSERAVKLTDDQKLKAPSTGWQTAQCYYTVNPVKEAQKKKEQIELQMKRKAEVQMQLAGGGVEPASKSARWDQAGPAGEYGGGSGFGGQDDMMRDLILLGMLPTTSESQVRQYFQDLGAELALCQMKKSKDQQTGYAFIRFHQKDLETKMRRQKHIIDGRDCTLKIPDSRQADGGERGEKKVYVSYQDSSLTKEELRTHFEQFGSVEDVFIPTPWRYFAFVTFDDARVAQGLIGKEHNVRGVSLLMKRGQKPGTRAEPTSGMPGGRGFGGGDYGYGRGRDDRGRSSEFISYPGQYGSTERYPGDSKPPLPPTPGADPAYAAWYAQYGHLSAQSQQQQYQSFLQQTGQQSGAPGDDKPPGTEDSVDARTASYNAYMQYAYQQWMASQTGQSQSGSGDTDRYSSSSRDSYNSSGNGSGGGAPGAPGGPKYGPPVPGTNYAAMGYSYDNGRDGGPPKSPPRGGFGDRGGEGGSRRAFRN